MQGYNLLKLYSFITIFYQEWLLLENFCVILQRLHAEVHAKAEAEGWDYIYGKGVYYGALFFDSSTSRKQESLSKAKQQ